ncbi:MAG: M67 family metallopeptidase [Ilumatobacteraceae bacterium]
MTSELARTLSISGTLLEQIGAHAISCYPEEACGLLVGNSSTHTVLEFHSCVNIAKSARVYTLDPLQHLRIERDAESRGLDVIGVMHSHTHTEAYPSATDIGQAPDPTWHYMIVTLMRGVSEPRSFRIVNGKVAEEEVVSV